MKKPTNRCLRWIIETVEMYWSRFKGERFTEDGKPWEIEGSPAQKHREWFAGLPWYRKIKVVLIDEYLLLVILLILAGLVYGLFFSGGD